ncbi:MAG: DUF86 domain-containing protein [Patescibacteria group bacterium]
MKPKWKAYIAHILDAIEEILAYKTAHTHDQFLNSPWDQSAVIRHLEIIGEASSQIDQSIKDMYPSIPWRRMSGFRNVLIHEYFAVDPHLVWEVLEKDIPELQKELNKIDQ